MPNPANPNPAGQPAPAAAAATPSPASGFAAAAPVAAPAAGDPPQPAAGADPTPAAGDPPQIPEAYRAADGTLDSAKALEFLTSAETERATRLEKFGEVPEGDYAFSEIELEGGEKLAVDPSNEFLQGALGILKEAGIGQKGADQLVGAYLKAFAADIPKVVEGIREAERAAVATEIDSLGAEKQARIEKVSSSIDTLMGKDGAPLKGAGLKLLADVRSRETFEIVEALLSRLDPDGQRRQPGGQAPEVTKDAVTAIYGSRGFKQGAA